MMHSGPHPNNGNDILSVFELPIETGSRMLYEEDLAEQGFLNLLDDLSEKDPQNPAPACANPGEHQTGAGVSFPF